MPNNLKELLIAHMYLSMLKEWTCQFALNEFAKEYSHLVLNDEEYALVTKYEEIYVKCVEYYDENYDKLADNQYITPIQIEIALKKDMIDKFF